MLSGPYDSKVSSSLLFLLNTFPLKMGLKSNCGTGRLPGTNMLSFLYVTDNSSALLRWITPNKHSLTKTESISPAPLKIYTP